MSWENEIKKQTQWAFSEIRGLFDKLLSDLTRIKANASQPEKVQEIIQEVSELKYLKIDIFEGEEKW